jgi:hypothetical protein
MIITWKPIGSKKPNVEYRQPEPDTLQIGEHTLDMTRAQDGIFGIPPEFADYLHKAERRDGTLYLELLYRCNGSLKEPAPIDYGESEVLTWQR